MNHQLAAVINKAQVLELVHAMIDPRPGCAHPLRQVFLIDSGKDNPGSTFLAEMGKQDENPSHTLLAGIENLIDEILPNAFDAFPGLFSTLLLDLQLQRS